jgi:signal transduction histidine kinase
VSAEPRARRRAGLAAGTALAGGLVGVALTVLFTVLLVAILNFRHASLTARHAQQAIASANRLETLVLDLDAGLRGFLITNDERTLEPWREARADYPSEMRALLRLASDSPEQEARARSIKSAIDTYLDDFSTPLVDFMHRNPDAAKKVVAARRDEEELRPVRQRFDRFVAAERRVFEERDDSARATGRVAIALGAGSLGVAIALIALLTIYLARRVARPIDIAARTAERLAAGDLSSRVPLRGVGEVGRLERTFNSMAASLERGRQELEEQNRRLRESEQAKSDLVSSVSHELRTPLASILGFSDLLLRREFPSEERRRYLELVRGEAGRLSELLNDLLDLERIEQGAIELRRENVELNELLETQSFLYSAQSDKHEIDVDVPDEPVVVRGDRDRLAQVLGNLLSNAIKYSPGGGTVTVAASRSRARARVSVRDQGLGIPADQQPKVFTKFFRGEAGRHLGIRGTGLGLVLARQIVDAHGGRMGFESAEGRGSTFWVELPLGPRDGRGRGDGSRAPGSSASPAAGD